MSFGPESEPLDLQPLNVLIGINGSGKSNLIEAFSLLKHASRDIAEPIRRGGGIQEWIWKGNPSGQARLEMVANTTADKGPDIRYTLSIASIEGRFTLMDECIENAQAAPGHDQPYFYYRFNNGKPIINKREGERALRVEDVEANQSIIKQRKDPDSYPEIYKLGKAFDQIRIYRDWQLGRRMPARQPQPSDDDASFLKEDTSNLALVLNHLHGKPPIKKKILAALENLFPHIEDFGVRITANTVMPLLTEGNFSIPASRLSDGTLRYLCLLAILCHPEPPGLICIEEPELGLHPDVIPTLADLLVEASDRCQLIVTTHSDILIDALSERPESVVVCEKTAQGTENQRLNRAELKAFLQTYRLGQLWINGELGGTRW